jgi:N-acetylneuraminic acid mutarotase
MKTKLLLLVSTFLVTLTASAQWSPRANFPGIAKSKSTAFTIGGKIYVMGGVDNASNVLNDFWEYDISSNSWTQKPNFPGPERYGAVSFALNNKGYIATGGNDFGYLDDLWEYNPATSAWVQKTGLPAGQAQHENQRREAYSFVIGNKAYLGGGDGFVFGPNSTGNIAFYDLWEYDPATDSWIQKADIPDFLGRDFSIGVSINSKGYAGLGCNVQQNINHPSFWEYDPVSNSWTAKANFPTNFTVDAGAFVLDSTLYVVGGVNLNPVSLSNQFYKYNPGTDSWTQLSIFNGGAVAGEFAISTGTRAFAGTGYNANIVTRNDLWEFTIPSGINKNDLQKNISRIYPNPASDFIAVLVNPELSGSTYVISDMYGRSVLTGKLTKESSNINISELSAGTYIIKVGEDNQYSNKFLKN